MYTNNKLKNLTTLKTLAEFYNKIDTRPNIFNTPMDAEKAAELTVEVARCLFQMDEDVRQTCVNQLWSVPFYHMIVVAEPVPEPTLVYEQTIEELQKLCIHTSFTSAV